jgi:hypothetical protein
MNKTQTKKKLDKLWSEIVRSKGKCEICGKTEYLNSHHVIGRRSLNTRWDLKNGCCLCSGCHTFKNQSAHQDPLFFIDWMKKNRPEDLDYLNKKRIEPPKPFTLKDYEDKLEELSSVSLN